MNMKNVSDEDEDVVELIDKSSEIQASSSCADRQGLHVT
jgi:hypothetical protein